MPPRWVICGFLLSLLITYSTEDRRKYNVFGKKPYRSSYGRSGISRNRMGILFGSAAALGTIYIASQMRPRVRINSYHDLYSHSVCEGRPAIYDNSGPRPPGSYSYYLCPSDPNKPFETYCCTDPTSGLGVCCSVDQKRYLYHSNRWGFAGGSIAALAIFVLVGATIYCLCCRRRRRQPSIPDLPVAETPPPIVGAMNVYPTNKPDFTPFAPPPAYPYPPGPPGSGVYPPSTGGVYPPMPPPQAQIGSGWNAPMNAWPGVPPPPYSANPSAPPIPPN